MSNKLRAVLLDFNDIVNPLYPLFEPANLDDLLEENEKKPDCVITWNDVLDVYQMIHVVANRHKIPTFMIQHGRRSFGDYVVGRSKPLANVAFAWSEYDREKAIAGGWKPEQVFVVGCPLFRERPKRNELKGTVVLDALHWNDETKENFEAWYHILKTPNITPVVKLIADERSHDPEKFPLGRKVLTDRSHPGHLAATYKLLSEASVVVTFLEDTLTLLAYSLDIPVIFLNEFKPRPFRGFMPPVEDISATEAATITNYAGLSQTITHAIEHPEDKREERLAVLVREGGNPDTVQPYTSMMMIIQQIVASWKKRQEPMIKKYASKNPGV